MPYTTIIPSVLLATVAYQGNHQNHEPQTNNSPHPQHPGAQKQPISPPASTWINTPHNIPDSGDPNRQGASGFSNSLCNDITDGSCTAYHDPSTQAGWFVSNLNKDELIALLERYVLKLPPAVLVRRQYRNRNPVYQWRYLQRRYFNQWSTSGQGSCYESGNTYVGDWENGEIRIGIFKTDIFTYSGHFKNKKEGHETHSFRTHYEGNFHNHQYHGPGTITYPDGSSYTGTFSEGSINGYGVFTTAEKVKVAGIFENGKLI